MKKWIHDYQWHLLAIAWGCAMFLGIAGFNQHAALHNLPNSFWDNLYLTLQLIPMHSGDAQPPVPWMLEIARFAIPLLTAAVEVKALFVLFDLQIQKLRLSKLNGHIVICGLSRKGFLLASQFRLMGKPVVVIEWDDENEWIESCREQGMYVLLGDASDSNLLMKARILHAEGLFAVCDNDGINVEIALHTQDLVKKRDGEPLICLLHVSDPQLCNLLREQETRLEQAPFKLELFNVYERAALNMLREHPAWSETEIQAEKPPHILIVGLGRLGENLLLHVSKDPSIDMGHIRVSIIDRNAIQRIESLGVRYPEIFNTCELIPLQMEIHSPDFERSNFLFNAQSQTDINSIYVCLDDDALGLQVGLNLMRRIGESNIPIVVRMAEESGLAKLLAFRRNQQDMYRNLFAFGVLDRTCTPDLLIKNQNNML